MPERMWRSNGPQDRERSIGRNAHEIDFAGDDRRRHTQSVSVGGGIEGHADFSLGTERNAEFRGRGPRGYRRSDERIREEVCEALTDSPMIDASNMDVTVENCEVTLEGTVTSREDKRRAEDIADSVAGVRDVHNRLRIQSDLEDKGMTSSPMSDMTATQAPGH